MDKILYLPEEYQSGFVTISSNIWTSLNTHPGYTAEQLASAVGCTLAQANAALDTLVAQRIVVQKYDVVGVACYWKSSQYETLLLANIASARSWVAAHNGDTVANMATALGVAYGIADGLAEALQAECSAKILFV